MKALILLGVLAFCSVAEAQPVTVHVPANRSVVIVHRPWFPFFGRRTVIHTNGPACVNCR
jgi:hypothetical protein